VNDAELLGLAARLAGDAGKAAPSGLERLSGGKNNRVYRVRLNDGSYAVLKLYHHDERDPRDRLKAEWEFIDYVWQRGVRNVPEPLAMDRTAHAGLYGFVEGRRKAPEEIDAATIAAASDFFVAINSAPREPERLAPGSEACFSLVDHLATIDRRVARLATLDGEAPLVSEAERLVETRLAPLWAKVRSGIEEAATGAGIDLSAPVGVTSVSPSDFGFHNALFDDEGRATFLDFEYAGRDDPAKLACDFFCQPEVPVPLGFFESFLAAIAPPLGLGEADIWRCRALLPAYRIKWVCIILNEFLAVGASRRAFADDGDRAARARRQIERAERHLALVTT
jgi:hypothetical protein